MVVREVPQKVSCSSKQKLLEVGQNHGKETVTRERCIATETEAILSSSMSESDVEYILRAVVQSAWPKK